MVVIVRSLFNDLVRFSALNHAYLTKVAQEVGPHDVMLIEFKLVKQVIKAAGWVLIFELT